MPEEIVRTLTVDGLSYSYRLVPGPRTRTDPVLVLGGALQGMYGWPQIEDRLGSVTDVITADLPGTGSADPLAAHDALPLLCRATERIIDDLGVDRVNLFGYSFGAVIAYLCAQRRPRLVSRLVLGGVPTSLSDAQYARLQELSEELEAGRLHEFAALFAESMLCRDPALPVLHRHLAYRYVKRAVYQTYSRTPHAQASLERALSTAVPSLEGGLDGVPTLVFSGEHDNLTPVDEQRAFASTIEHGTFLQVRDSDHWVVLERAHDVADLALRYFTGRSLKDAPYVLPEKNGTGYGTAAQNGVLPEQSASRAGIVGVASR
ncbi:alpha/beta hydrolase [Streptomyces sp. NBC_01433]|uniref:alpha/beta fold hydrolase n=1 Tax=Streptomyces sp. NBC_01433 TaxID=2903864 RepID=UPI0022583DC8|nr:alpha/beta fold hydrolase [Streptomyces sp. NBC_01433]MCX4681758.1 alpha/beta hydrolase [Streptomyces sp. NBC_01433]